MLSMWTALSKLIFKLRWCIVNMHWSIWSSITNVMFSLFCVSIMLTKAPDSWQMCTIYLCDSLFSFYPTTCNRGPAIGSLAGESRGQGHPLPTSPFFSLFCSLSSHEVVQCTRCLHRFMFDMCHSNSCTSLWGLCRTYEKFDISYSLIYWILYSWVSQYSQLSRVRGGTWSFYKPPHLFTMQCREVLPCKRHKHTGLIAMSSSA